MKNTFKDSVILFGGSSEERMVSVASAQNLSKQIPEAAMWFLTQEGKIHTVTQKEISLHDNAFIKQFIPQTEPTFKNLQESFPSLKDKTVIIALHGTEGEDGSIQADFEKAKINFTGTKSKASALAFDKVKTKQIARKNDLPLVDELIIHKFDDSAIKKLQDFCNRHQKIVLKPFANGSSVGLFIISTTQDLTDALDSIKKKNLHDYLAEPFIHGREITVGVREKIDGTITSLPCSEVRVIQGRQFDYEGKYLGKGVEELTPAPLSPEEAKACQDLALKVHSLVGCRGYSRTDMILTEKGPVLLEINTLPGLSKASFIPQQLIANGENLRDFFLEQINIP